MVCVCLNSRENCVAGVAVQLPIAPGEQAASRAVVGTVVLSGVFYFKCDTAPICSYGVCTPYGGQIAQ